MTIKHISFDVWNTLITANPEYATARNKILAEYAGMAEEDAGIIYKEIKWSLDKEAESGYCGGTFNAWVKLGKNLNIELEAIAEMQYMCEQAFIANPPHLNEDLVDQLISLDDKYELSIKSNTNFISGNVLSKAIGFDRMSWWSFMHFSDQHMLCKPDIRFFAKTLLESKLKTLSNYEILHVGDSEIFDGKCVDIGFNFCKVQNPKDLLFKLKNGELINA